MSSVFLNYGTSYFDLLSQSIADNEAEITDIDFLKINKPDPIIPNALLYSLVDGNAASSEILCQSNNALQSVGCLQLPGTAVNPASIIPELSGQDATTVWLSSINGHLYRGSVDLESGGGGGGDVVGAVSSTDNAIVRFDGATGKVIQNSLSTLRDDGSIAFPEITTALHQGVNVLLGVDRTRKVVHLGRANNYDKMVMIGVNDYGDSNLVQNGVIIGHDSCSGAAGIESDVIVMGNDVGTADGSKVIVIGNRVCQLPTALYRLGTDNISIGHEVNIVNSSVDNCLMGNYTRVQGSRNSIIGNYANSGGSSGDDNVVIGYEALSSATAFARNNVLVGCRALSSALSPSDNNIVIGANIGSAITGGINDCVWIDATGVNNEVNTVRIGSNSKTACYLGGIFGSAVGTSGFTAKIDSVGKMFSSTVARPCVSFVTYGVNEGDAFDWTTSFATIAFNGVFNSFVDVVGFTIPTPGKYQYNGLFTGDTTARKFRITCFLNHGIYNNESVVSFAVNDIPVGGDYRLQTNSSAACLSMGDVITLIPGQYASVVAKSTVVGSMDVYKMSVFMELLK